MSNASHFKNMKKSSFLIPLSLAGIVLIFVVIKAFNHNAFRRTPAETLQMAKGNIHFIGPAAIISIPDEQALIIEIGAEQVLPSFPSGIEIKLIDFNHLLSVETRKLLSENKKKKIIYAQDITIAVKTWTFLTRLGYNDLYIYDPDEKHPTGQIDSVLHGNEEMQYIFKPEKSEAK
jgi:hypothetical protein